MNRIFLIVLAILMGILMGEAFYLLYLNNTSFIQSFFKPKPGSCLVLEEKYCRKGVVISTDGKFVGIGFHVPDKTVLFSPFEGKVNTPMVTVAVGKKTDSYPGIRIATRYVGNKIKEFILSATVVYREAKPLQNTPDIQTGEVFGIVSSQPFDLFPSYNLFIYFSVPGPTGLIKTDKEFTLKNFHL